MNDGSNYGAEFKALLSKLHLAYTAYEDGYEPIDKAEKHQEWERLKVEFNQLVDEHVRKLKQGERPS